MITASYIVDLIPMGKEGPIACPLPDLIANYNERKGSRLLKLYSFQTITSETPLRASPLLVKTMRSLSLFTGAKVAEFH